MDYVVLKLIISVSGILYLTGCGATRFTQQEREESFKPYEGLKVFDEVTIREFVVRRTALLIRADKFREVTLAEANGDISIKGMGEPPSFGSAAAVDRRGYFVTAAHCVDSGELRLAFLTPAGPRMEKARVVWAGEPSTTEFDFALLHVPSQLEQVFEWVPDFRTGDLVFSAGTNLNLEAEDSKLDISVGTIGGRLVGVLSRQAGKVPYEVLIHDSPIVKGNSGEPLVARDGRLLGINFAGRTRFLLPWDTRTRSAHAVRPDPDWVARLIDLDQNRNSRTRRR